MVLFFRKQAFRILFRVILVVIAGSMLVGIGLTQLKKSAKKHAAVATVDGEDIDYRDFARREQAKREQLALLRYQFEQMGMPFDPSILSIDAKKIAFSGLVEETLLNKVARSLGIQLNDEYISSKFNDSYFVTQKISEFFPSYLAVAQDLDHDVLDRMLRKQGMSITDFESFVVDDLRRSLVKSLAVNALYTPEFMVKRKYEQEYASKKFAAVALPLDMFLKKVEKTPLSDAEMQQFFNERNRDYTVPEKRSGTMWEFSPENYGIALSDDMIKSYYNDHKDKFVASPAQMKVRRIVFKAPDEDGLMAAKVKAEAVHAEVAQNPDLFEEKARQLSEDATTAKQGGLVDFFARGDKDPAFEKAAFRLKHDGDVSPLIQTQDGIEIIQRVARKPLVHKDLSLVSSEIRSLLAKQEFKRRFDNDVAQLVNNAQGSANFEEFAGAKKAKKVSLPLAAHQDTLEGDALFHIKEGFSAYQDGDKGKVVHVDKVQKSYVPRFVDVKDKVAKDLYKVKAERELTAALNKARGESLQQVAQENATKVRNVGWLKEGSDNIKKLTEEGFPVAQMLQMEKKGEFNVYLNDSDGYVVRLEEVEPLKGDDFKEKKDELQHELSRNNSYVALNGFVASLARNATLKTHEKELESYDLGDQS